MQADLKRYISENFHTALEKHYIQVYYQPVIRTLSGRLCGFEALARWIDPVHGMIMPGQFIPVLEQEERIHLLDGYVIREVCRLIRRRIDNEQLPIPVSFNLSRLDFKLCDVFEIVDGSAREFQVPHEALHVEITESVAAEQESLLYELIDRFHTAGYQVWMDDFGSGYSTLNVLKDYPFDELKLDMRFLSSLSGRSLKVLNSIIQMAKEIGMHTLTEGVETEEQYRYLCDIGCEKVQGFYFARPLPFDEALAALEERGIGIEKPGELKYYDNIGMVNVLSSIPYKDERERAETPEARRLNSIPLALAEIRGEGFSMLFCNSAFEESALATGYLTNIFQTELRGTLLPFSHVPARAYSLVESCRNGGEGRIQFVANEDYYELQCRCLARMHGAYCVLLQLRNLSQASRSAQTGQLDESLRLLYTIYDSISLLDTGRDVFTPLYVGTMADITMEREGLQEYLQEYCSHWIFREDWEEFERFHDLATLDARIDESRSGHVSVYLRTRQRRGRYGWKLYTLLRLRRGHYIELVRDVRAEFEALGEKMGRNEQGISPELLWKNLLNSNLVRLFWKDADRRFLGVSSSFLEYYDFSSQAAVLGKTDEEMGWHVHPDAFMNDELKVLQEGVSFHNMPGTCFSRGENREILASKVPLYAENGEILGLMGCFTDLELLNINDSRGGEVLRRDQMTGLLNTRGLYEEAHAFKDEYYLRKTDFARLLVSIDDLASINRQYGFDFGDKAIAALGRHLKDAFGTSSAVGRINGYQFVILRQIRRGELGELQRMVRQACNGIREIDGVPITLYFSCGIALFSESENLEQQNQQAEMRMLADHDEHTSAENRLSRATEIFRTYDELPIATAVFKVVEEDGRVKDAILFYLNHTYEERIGMKAIELIGRRTREAFPEMGDDWYELAGRVALQGETVRSCRFFERSQMHYYMTGTPVIRRGYCCFTFQIVDKIDELRDKIQ